MQRKRPGSFCCLLSDLTALLPRAVKTMLGSLRTCAARRPANLMATSFARRTKAGSAESVTSSVSLPPDPLTIQRSIGGQFRCSCGWFCTGILLPFATVNSSDPTLFHHLSSPFNALRCCSMLRSTFVLLAAVNMPSGRFEQRFLRVGMLPASTNACV